MRDSFSIQIPTDRPKHLPRTKRTLLKGAPYRLYLTTSFGLIPSESCRTEITFRQKVISMRVKYFTKFRFVIKD